MQPALNATVFIVDDDASVREALAWLLRSRHLPSESYAGGHEFQAMLDRGFKLSQPSCLLLDVRMPGMSGLALFDDLAGRGLVEAMPVIFLTGHADVPTAVDLVKRGAFVRRQFLCDPLKPPDPAQLPAGSLVPPEKDHRLTTRQRWEARTAPAICQGCHRLINPLGASLEAYDAIGRFRRFEKLPVPKSSPPRFIEHHIDTAVNPFIERRAEPVLKGPVALSALLGESPKANACFVEQLTKFVSGRALEREDMVRLEIVTDKMMQPGGSVQDVLLSVVKLHATREIGSPFP